MPKQSSIFKVRGKMDGNSFYYSPLGGYQFRKINPNMSERVKTEDQFINTRRNAAEFGAAGSMAGAICRAFYQSFRFVATPKMNGILTKLIDRLIRGNTSGIWGERNVMPTLMPQIEEAFNVCMKNQMPELLKSYVVNHVRWDAVNDQIVGDEVLQTTAEFEQELLNKGATGFGFLLFIMGATNPQYASVIRKYLPCSPLIEQLGVGSAYIQVDGTGNHTIVNIFAGTTGFVPQNTTNHAAGLLAVYMPTRQTGTVNTVLQDQCSAFWYPVPDQSE
jgi:hypothetical protein